MKVKVTAISLQESVEKKLKIAAELFAFAYRVKRAQVDRKFPDWSEVKKNTYVYSLIERGCK